MVNDGKLCACIVECFDTETGQQVKFDRERLAGYKFWVIKHDKDVKDNGEPKHEHYHVIVEVPERHRKQFFIDIISNVFNCRKELVTADVLLNKQKRSNLRYLIHKDDTEKYQYNPDLVMSNDNSAFRNALEDSITTDYVLDIISRSENMTEVIKVLGLDVYKLYSHAIDIMWHENKF